MYNNTFAHFVRLQTQNAILFTKILYDRLMQSRPLRKNSQSTVQSNIWNIISMVIIQNYYNFDVNYLNSCVRQVSRKNKVKQKGPEHIISIAEK